MARSYSAASTSLVLLLTARRLGLVTAEQMIAAMVGAIERPASGVLGVPEIRGMSNARLLAAELRLR
jgi:hypothetical protein